MDASTRAVATAAVATALAVCAYLDPLLLVGLIAVLVVVFAIGWPALLGLPAPLGGRVVIGLGGLGALLAIQQTEGEPFLRGLPIVFALAIVLAFVNELMRVDGRERLVESVSGVITGVLIATAAAGWVAAQRTAGGTSIVVVGAVALAVGAAVSVIPVSIWVSAGVTVAASGAVGAALGLAMPGLEPLPGGIIGVAVGILGVTLHELFDRLPALAHRWASVGAIVLPVTVTGTLVYVVGRVLVG